MQKGTLRGGVVAALMVALAAAGCGSSSHNSSNGTTATTAAAGGTSTPSVTSGGTPSSTQGITSTTITVGELADVSGPVPGLFSGAVDGLDAWAAKVNAAGGIDGRKIVVKHRDAALSCNTYTNAFSSLASSVFAVVGTYSLVDICGEKTLLAKPSFPDIQGVVLNPSIGSLPNVFGAVPAVNGHSNTGYLWVKNTYGADAVKHAGTLYGQGAAASHALEVPAAESAGWKYVYTRAFGNTETNYTSDILRMKNENVQVLDLTDMSAGDLAGFLNQAAQQGFKPKAIVTTAGYDGQMFKLLGSNPSNANNLVLPLPYAMYLGEDAADVPEITTMTNWLHKTHGGDPMNLYVMESYAAGLLFQQAMGTLGSNPTQAGLIQAVTKITNFTADGLLPPSNVGGKKGVVCSAIVQAKDGKFVRTDPKGKGYECNGSFIVQPVKS